MAGNRTRLTQQNTGHRRHTKEKKAMVSVDMSILYKKLEESCG